ncbi:MAG: SUKH-3 domain-containing protein [Oscillospiraceae bacterium]
MISDEFKLIKKGTLGTFYDYSRNHTIEETMEKLALENMIENTGKVIEYIQNYGFFEFERTENKSGDIIRFYSNPLSYINPYWEEFNNKAFYIGKYTNSSCGNRPDISWIEQFYMLSDGSFYNQDKIKISDNDDGFFDYIMTVEYDYHAPILKSTYRRLKESGWYEGRKIEISEHVKECAENGVYLTEPQMRFVEEFGGIEGSTEDGCNNYFYISDRRSSPYSKGEPVYFVNILKDENLLIQLDEEEIIEIVQKYGKNTVYIGNCQYNSNPILLSESGNMLLVSCGDVKPLGRTVMEGFNAILGDI